MLPLTRPGDATSHMQTVLLQAFCYENYIPVIQVDSSERLAEFCGISPTKGKPAECFCAIITRDPNNDPDEDPPLSPSEQTLTDFYECTLEEYPRPVVHLPPLATWINEEWVETAPDENADKNTWNRNVIPGWL